MSLPETQNDAKTLPDAWDYKGRPSLRSSSGGWASGAMILGVLVLLFLFFFFRVIWCVSTTFLVKLVR